MTTDNEELGLDNRTDLDGPEGTFVPEDTNDDEEESKQDKLVTLALDPDDISGSLDRLMQENPKVLNVVNTLIGNKARNKYNPRIQELELELEGLRAQPRLDAVNNMPQDELAERLKDPDFRREYNDTLSIPDVLAQKRQQTAVARRIAETIDQAQDAGLSTSSANSILERLANGEFDTDENGQPISDISVAMSNLNKAIYSEFSVAPKSSNGSVADVSDALDTASPDVSSSSSSSSKSGVSFSIDQVNRMDPMEFERHFPQDDDFNQAVRDGRITGLSPESVAALQ